LSIASNNIRFSEAKLTLLRPRTHKPGGVTHRVDVRFTPKATRLLRSSENDAIGLLPPGVLLAGWCDLRVGFAYYDSIRMPSLSTTDE